MQLSSCLDVILVVSSECHRLHMYLPWATFYHQQQSFVMDFEPTSRNWVGSPAFEQIEGLVEYYKTSEIL